MKKCSVLLCLVLLLTLAVPACALAAAPVKVACVGDSITFGTGTEDPAVQAYPAQLQQLLGDGYQVKNFGVSGVTALKDAVPYTATPEYQESLSYCPDILLLMLGTNDIKGVNWSKGKDRFLEDYLSIAKAYQSVNPKVRILIGLPPRIFKENVYATGTTRDPAVLEQEGFPLIREAAKELGATLVDVFNATLNYGSLFEDYLHPNAQGAAIIARAFADALQGTPETPTPAAPVQGADSWAADELAAAAQLNLIPEGIGEMQSDITRLYFCKIAAALFPEATASAAPFTDTSDPDVAKAYALGLTKGVDAQTFAPDNLITREEICTMLYRAYLLLGASPVSGVSVTAFPDYDQISGWARASVGAMSQLGIVQGDETGMRPQSNTTVQEAIVLALRTARKAKP